MRGVPAVTMKSDWGAHPPSGAADGALAVRVVRVELPPFSMRLRATAGVRAPQPAHDSRAFPCDSQMH